MTVPLRDDEGSIITDDSITAEVLNDYFASVFTKESLTDMPEPVQEFKGEVEHKLFTMGFTPDEVSKKIFTMKPNKAPGPDGIGSHILKETADCLAKPLARIFQCSLKENYIPPDCKSANVTPIFKKAPKSVPANYHPVSLTSQLCKLMESMIRDHLRHHNLLRQSQHGFLRRRSCLTNMLVFLEKVTNYIEQGLPVDIIFLDFQKAFDKVPHARLMDKVKAHGIDGHIWKWIDN